MPSPFPGMDPYLEAPALWPGVHHRLITYIADSLSERLPQRYVANIDERLVVVESERNLYPDTLVRERVEAERRPTIMNGGAAAALATESDPAVRVSLEPETVAQAFIEIRLANSEGQVVAVIEVLSPGNKQAGSAGRTQYLAKQGELLQSRIHLLEIDLLRGGAHTVAAPRQRVLGLARWDFIISLHRGEESECDVWPVAVRQRLPRIRVPLTLGDPDIILDLQEMVTHCYDVGRYARHIDYRHDPAPPLVAADAEWAAALLRERGLRPE